MDEHYAVGEFTAQLLGWSTQRRFVVVRETIREGKAAVGRKLIDLPGYTFRIWVTNRWRYGGITTAGPPSNSASRSWHDLAADGFCTQNFWATEAAFLAVLFTFNLLSLYQQTATPKAGYRQPATLRTTVFLCGAILGRTGRQAVLHLSAAWGGLEKHKPLLEALFHWPPPTPPKFHLPSKPTELNG